MLELSPEDDKEIDKVYVYGGKYDSTCRETV